MEYDERKNKAKSESIGITFTDFFSGAKKCFSDKINNFLIW